MTTLDIRSGPWGRADIEGFLSETTIPIRIASAGRTSPLVQSLWFLYDEGAIWCCTQREAILTRRLIADPRCGFEVSGDQPPYRGVRGTAKAEILPDRAADMLPRLIARYLGDEPSPLADWLLSRLDREVAIRLHDLSVTTFDFTPRMS
ncbi:MAG: pyridoxamine 5'-phosphate oxidase family protein [Candidatus Nanopelagicales bacterium]